MSERFLGANRRILVAGLVIGVLVPSATNAADLWRQDESALRLTGYYKNLVARSETVQDAELYTLDLNRLRVELQGNLSERAALDVQYDHEAFAGSALRTDEFSTRTRRDPETYLDLENAYVDRADLFARHRLYRGYVTISAPYADVTVGRQRVAWGTARFWNPTDLLNPFNPIQIEREERAGTDAVLADIHLGPLSTLSLVYAPGAARDESNVAARVRGNRSGFDLSAMGGRFRKDAVLGFDFAGSIENLGVRGEATYTASRRRDDFPRAVLGADYTFPNTLSLVVEYYYNGEGRARKEDYEFQRLLSGDLLSLARHYLGASVGYDLTPLLRGDVYAVVNLNDGSVFFAPTLTWSLVTDVDLVVGTQFFSGADGSEYGAFHTLFYAQLQWFF